MYKLTDSFVLIFFLFLQFFLSVAYITLNKLFAVFIYYLTIGAYMRSKALSKSTNKFLIIFSEQSDATNNSCMTFGRDWVVERP